MTLWKWCIARENEAVLCRLAPWECFGDSIAPVIGNCEVAQETGSKRPTVQFNKSPTLSHVEPLIVHYWRHIAGLCSSSARWPLAPNFCPRATRKSQIFHTNHMLGTLDFTVSEHWAPFNFPQSSQPCIVPTAIFVQAESRPLKKTI